MFTGGVALIVISHLCLGTVNHRDLRLDTLCMQLVKLNVNRGYAGNPMVIVGRSLVMACSAVVL
jgi:hypothetical protein